MEIYTRMLEASQSRILVHLAFISRARTGRYQKFALETAAPGARSLPRGSKAG